MPLGDPVQPSRDCHPRYAPDPHHRPQYRWSHGSRRAGQTGPRRQRPGRSPPVSRTPCPFPALPRPDLPSFQRPPQNPAEPRRAYRGGRVLQVDRLARGVYPVPQAVTWRMSSVISVATLTTSPTTTIAGGRIPSSATRLSTCSHGELIVRCLGRGPPPNTQKRESRLRPTSKM